jgi:hypothetical protein
VGGFEDIILYLSDPKKQLFSTMPPAVSLLNLERLYHFRRFFSERGYLCIWAEGLNMVGL